MKQHTPPVKGPARKTISITQSNRIFSQYDFSLGLNDLELWDSLDSLELWEIGDLDPKPNHYTYTSLHFIYKQ
jgi:hypothetical protein